MESITSFDTLKAHRSNCATNVVEQNTEAQLHTRLHEERIQIGLKRAGQIDLGMVRMKLINNDDIVKIELGQIDKSIYHYREFLALLYAYPDRTIVPTKMIDAVWHYHILDTRAYAIDTQRMFGSFLHHYPYFGMRDSEDAKDLAASFEQTCVLWQKHFGHSPSTTAPLDATMGRCGGRCSSCKT